MRVVHLLVIFTLTLAACNGQPTTPSAYAPPNASLPPRGAPPIPLGSHSLTGIITERSPQGERPLVGANVNAWIQTEKVGYSYMFLNGARLTDAQGRYELANLPDGATLQLEVYKRGYLNQCAAPQLLVNTDLHLDAQLVPFANVSASRDSVPPSAPGFRVISGVVYEIIGEGRRPAPGVFVDYEPIADSPAAVTSTDSEGRFLLCGITQTTSATIGAALDSGRYAYSAVPPGPDASIEIEIK
jgi:hypothetical protein